MHLPAHQLAAFQADAALLVQQALAESDSFTHRGISMFEASTGWTQVAGADAIRVFRKKDQRHPNRLHYRVCGELSLSYREILRFHYAETTEDTFEWLHLLHHNVLDAALLARFQIADRAHPWRFLGLVYMATQPVPWAKTYSSYLEYLDQVENAQGHTIGVRVTMPIDVPALAPLMRARKAQHVEHVVVQLFRPENEMTQVFSVVRYDHAAFDALVFGRQLLETMRRMRIAAEARAILQRGLIAREQWMPANTASHCRSCRRAFLAMRTRHHCRLCGHVICRRCVVSRPIAGPSDDRTFKLDKAKFCVACIAQLWSDHDPAATDECEAMAIPSLRPCKTPMRPTSSTNATDSISSYSCSQSISTCTDRQTRSNVVSDCDDGDGDHASFARRPESDIEAMDVVDSEALQDLVSPLPWPQFELQDDIAMLERSSDSSDRHPALLEMTLLESSNALTP